MPSSRLGFSGGYGGSLLVISLLAAFGYKSAIRRFDRYTIT
ncbi:hypothetical protein [Haladaptatus sp. CMSO5]